MFFFTEVVFLDRSMNYKSEPYPENITDLLKQADDLSFYIVSKLNSNNCKTVSDLYSSLNGKIIRNKKQFDELGYEPNTLSNTNSKNQVNNEFKGLYIFGDEVNGKVIPVYVGISRSIFRRLKQHAWGMKHNECSLAYLKTKHNWALEDKIVNRASIRDQDMLSAKSVIQNYKVVLVEVQNDYDLYFLEVTLAGIFRTKWNSFKTH